MRQNNCARWWDRDCAEIESTGKDASCFRQRERKKREEKGKDKMDFRQFRREMERAR